MYGRKWSGNSLLSGSLMRRASGTCSSSFLASVIFHLAPHLLHEKEASFTCMNTWAPSNFEPFIKRFSASDRDLNVKLHQLSDINIDLLDRFCVVLFGFQEHYVYNALGDAELVHVYWKLAIDISILDRAKMKPLRVVVMANLYCMHHENHRLERVVIRAHLET